MSDNFSGQDAAGNNPFSPTTAMPVESDNEQFNPAGRSLPAGNGWQWIVSAWDMFKAQPLPWLLVAMGFGMLGVIPLIQVLVAFFGLFFMGAAAFAADRQHREGKIEILDFVTGLQRHFAPLAMLGLITLSIVALIVLIVGVTAGASYALAFVSSGDVSGANLSIASMIVGGLICVAMGFVLLAALWFAPALIVLQKMTCVNAMITSLKIVLTKNIGAFLIYGLANFGLRILTLLPLVFGISPTITLGLGSLILFPVTLISVYTSYRDIFIEE